MAKKKIELPAYWGPIQDLIPNEVLYDTFKLNVWVGTFVATFGLLTTAEQATDNSKRVKVFGASLYQIAQMALPGLGTLDMLVGTGKGPFGESEEDDTGSDYGIVVDWGSLQQQAYDKGNDLEYAVISVMKDDFIRRSLIASAVASATVWSMFETKMMDNALTAAAEGARAAAEALPL